MAFGQAVRLLEKGLGGHREELGRIGGTVMVEHPLLAEPGIVAQGGEVARTLLQARLSRGASRVRSAPHARVHNMCMCRGMVDRMVVASSA